MMYCGGLSPLPAFPLTGSHRTLSAWPPLGSTLSSLVTPEEDPLAIKGWDGNTADSCHCDVAS